MLDDAKLLEELRRHWDLTGKDEEGAHEIYRADAVLELPQSGERFEGVHNFQYWRREYPADLQVKTRRISNSGELVVVENLISFEGKPWMFTVHILQFRGDKVAHERIYIMDGWPPAEWRTPWRSQTPADAPVEPPIPRSPV